MIDTTVHAQEPPPGYLRAANLLAALSLASDLAVGLPAEHAARSCYIAMHVPEQMQLPAEQQIDLYYAMVLMDAGCTAWTSQLAGLIVSDEIAARRDFLFHRNARDAVDVFGWMKEHVASGESVPRRVRQGLQFALQGREFVREGFRNTCDAHSASHSGWACRKQSSMRCCRYSNSGTAADSAARERSGARRLSSCYRRETPYILRRSANVAAAPSMGYCMKCKAQREIKAPKQITMKNGRPATQGTCQICGTKIFKIGAAM